MFDIFLIDKNSTNNTAQIAKDYWNQLNSNYDLKIIIEHKVGKVHALRTGIQYATYEFVLFVDDDNCLFDYYARLRV